MKRKISLVDLHGIAWAIPMIQYAEQQTQMIRAEMVQPHIGRFIAVMVFLFVITRS